MANQTRANKFPYESCEIRSNGAHAVAEVFGELATIGGDRYYLVTEGVNMCNIGVRNFCPHRYFCGSFKDCFEIFW